MCRLTKYSFFNKSLVSDIFIETGTFRGDTLLYAANAGFKELHSIEFDITNFKVASDNVKGIPNIHLYLGSSPDILPKIIDPSKTTTFWLDAHFQGGKLCEIDTNYGECPLIKELEIITNIKWATMPIILIDDANMFYKLPTNFNSLAWPSLKQICNMLNRWDVNISINDDIIYGFPI